MFFSITVLIPFLFLSLSVQTSHFSSKTSKSHLSLSLTRHEFYDKSLENIENVQYQTTLSFGSLKQTFSLALDTGSSDLYIPSSSNTECLTVNQYLLKKTEPELPLFNCSTSETCEETGKTIVLGYNDGSVWTKAVWDQVRISSELAIKNHSFLLDYKTIGNFECYGIWGLGFPSLAMNRNPGLLQGLLKENQIESYIFGLYLTANESGSKLIIGGIDDSLLSDPDEIAYFPFVSDESYSISIDTLALNSSEIDLDGVSLALIDSGNSLITLPSQITDQIITYFNDKMNVNCFYEIEDSAPDYSLILCEINENSMKFPEIKIGLKGQSIILQPEDYIEECEILSNNTAFCYLYLEKSTIDNEIILGDALLRSFYSIFNLDNNTLGLSRNINKNTIIVINADIESSSVNLMGENAVITEVSNGNKVFSWKVYAMFTGFLVLFPLIYFSSYLLRRKEIIDENMNYTILGASFLIIIISINLVITFL